MEQVRRSNTVIYGEHYISAIYYGPCNSNNTAPSIGTITKRNITTGLFGLRTMRCITTTNKFSGIRFCFGIFVSRNKGFILNYLNRTCTSYRLVFLEVTLCLYSLFYVNIMDLLLAWYLRQN